jgi:hypothetical protein
MKDKYTLPEFETILKKSPLWQSEIFKHYWADLMSRQQQVEYMTWFISDRKKSYDEFLNEPGRHDAPVPDLIEYFGKFTEESLKSPERGGSSRHRRRRRSIPKSSRKYKKSAKRVFRKKSRSTRRR